MTATSTLQHVLFPASWEYYTLTQGGAEKARVEFDWRAALDFQHKGYGSGFRFVIFLNTDNCSELGMPGPEANAEADPIEQSLYQMLEEKRVDCKVVARLTYAAMREIVFQSAERKAFLVQVSPWSKKTPVECELHEYEGWSFFDEQVAPNESMLRQINDRKAVEQLIAQGHPAGNSIQLIHRFAGNADALVNLESELIMDRFAVKAKGEGYLLLQREISLEAQAVFRLTLALSAFSSDVGATYEGWIPA